MMRFNDGAGPPKSRPGLNDIRIQGPLGQKGHASIFRASFSKALMNVRPMIFRFFSGSSTPFRRERKARLALMNSKVHLKMLSEKGLDLFCLILSQKAVVHENTCQLACRWPYEEEGPPQRNPPRHSIPGSPFYPLRQI